MICKKLFVLCSSISRKMTTPEKKSCVCIITHIEKAFDAFNCCISRDECTRATENVAWNAELLRLNRYAVWWGSLNCILRAKMCKFLWPTFMYILVSTAACTLYRNCKDASKRVRGRARERSSLHSLSSYYSTRNAINWQPTAYSPCKVHGRIHLIR